MINIKENIKNVEELFYSVSAYDDNKIVGYGRIIGDTICFFYI